jgi:hypothetical protein
MCIGAAEFLEANFPRDAQRDKLKQRREQKTALGLASE